MLNAMNHSPARIVKGVPNTVALVASAISAVIANTAITGVYEVAPGSGTDLPKKRRRSSLPPIRSEEHTSELQSLMRISYAVFCLKKKNKKYNKKQIQH